MTRPTLEFLRYLARRRGPATALTAAEQALLAELARGQRCAVEVGVFEGATSALLAAALAPQGRLWLVDPFVGYTRPERALGISFSRYIARRSVRPWRERVEFVRETSLAAARRLAPHCRAALIFIDADHSYAAVREDFLAWHPLLAPGGVVAFHDSRLCAARPDLSSQTGPVRLLSEIRRGDYGAWTLAATADSISVIRPGASSQPAE